MRKILFVLVAATLSMSAHAAVTIYTDKAAFLAATNATQFFWPDLGEGVVLNSPASLGNASISAAQLVSFHDGYYDDQVYVGASGPQDPANPSQNLAGNVTVTSADNFLALDLGAYFTPGTFLYQVNGQLGSIDLSSGTGFFGVVDTNPISATFYENGSDELDILHAYTSAGPTSEVPEPAGWALMIGGLGMVGAAMRRRPTTARFA